MIQQLNIQLLGNQQVGESMAQINHSSIHANNDTRRDVHPLCIIYRVQYAI